jgi:dihydroflavonol-4-reductase
VGSLGVSYDRESMDESHELNLEDPEIYVRSKLEAEQVALRFAEEGLPVVMVLPAAVSGPGDWKPTPTGDGLLRALASPGLMPLVEGGLSVVDVDDVARGHRLAMERGRVGERYILGGENLTYEQLFSELCALVGRRYSGRRISPALLGFIAWLMESKARLLGGEPLITTRVARDMPGAYMWVTSDKAASELGYRFRPARETLARCVRWYMLRGYLPASVAWRARLELGMAS